MKIDPGRAKQVRKFVGNLTHTIGKYAGKPFQMRDWQEDILVPLLATVDENGDRLYREAYISMARKNGKSEGIGAPLALYGLVVDQEPRAEVYSAASDREQAGIVFRMVADMVRNDPKLKKRLKVIDSRKRIVYPKLGSFYQVLSRESFSKHGYNPHFVIFDELHTQKNRKLYDVLTTGSGTRGEPLHVNLTTAGKRRDSICYETYKYAKKVERGELDSENADRFFTWIAETTDEDDWKDEASWEKANPALGDFRKKDEFVEKFQKAKERPSFKNTFKRLYLNRWTERGTVWIDMEMYDEIATIDTRLDSEFYEKRKGCDCWGALDLATNRDIAAFVLVFRDEDGFEVIPWFWVPEATAQQRADEDEIPIPKWVDQGYIFTTEGEVIDYKAIKDFILNKVGLDFNIQEIAYDRWGMAQLSQDLVDEGVELVPFNQRMSSMSPPTKELENKIYANDIILSDNKVLRWMFQHTEVREDHNENKKPDKKHSEEKIDGVVATIMALARAIQAETRPTESVYENYDVKTSGDSVYEGY